VNQYLVFATQDKDVRELEQLIQNLRQRKEMEAERVFEQVIST
jgi:hypothetical protein